MNRHRVEAKNLRLRVHGNTGHFLRPGKTQAGTRNTVPEIRDVPGNTGRLATLKITQKTSVDRKTDAVQGVMHPHGGLP